VFERLDQSLGAHLVVDLRNNGGGNSGVFDPNRPSTVPRSNPTSAWT
jgi:hypothetical protein